MFALLGFLLLFFANTAAYATTPLHGNWIVLVDEEALLDISGDKASMVFDGKPTSLHIFSQSDNLWGANLDNLQGYYQISLLDDDILCIRTAPEDGYSGVYYAVRKNTTAPQELIRGKWTYDISTGMVGTYDFDRKEYISPDGKIRTPFTVTYNKPGMLVITYASAIPIHTAFKRVSANFLLSGMSKFNQPDGQPSTDWPPALLHRHR